MGEGWSRKLMRRISVVFAVFAGIFCFATVPALTEAEGPSTLPQAPRKQAVEATVVKTVVKRPERVVHHRVRFRPPAHPSAGYVFAVIVPHEAARWGASRLILEHRIRCESGGHWYANNGQYNGIGQFATGTFYRGLSTIRTRRVSIRTVKVRRMHSRVYRHWSDGHVSRHKGRIVRQSVVTRRRGRITVGYTDAWPQARIMAQAIRGISAVHDSEWSCRG